MSLGPEWGCRAVCADCLQEQSGGKHQRAGAQSRAVGRYAPTACGSSQRRGWALLAVGLYALTSLGQGGAIGPTVCWLTPKVVVLGSTQTITINLSW